MDVKVNVSDDNGLDETYLGQLKAAGIEKGDFVAAQFLFGVQMNFGPVKVPWQVSIISGYQVGSVGLVLNF